ncbi:class I SAM-dependent methyltransferase [Trinickia dinghuensis]|uniref:Class I SAM-dependent methyltransferase n=1 Tax=Trinickia dinghuensis TaxID=2291023 RepID=A0A3D8JZX6_9BURK|nr:class I SAM-dependent methyltransferase [Trinickia dinghuensis]RDU98392.1 class I SAM-dependent methyltransferase [Trinickia dinghuensis]
MSNATASSDRNYPTVDYDAHARTCAPDAFWAQVKRTVHGKPVSEEQIEWIVGEIKRKLALVPEDVLLDLACGNGALSHRLVEDCSALVGVDISEYLIEVANRHFAEPPRVTFAAEGAAQFVSAHADPQRFTKVLCYGSFAYFSEEDARTTLRILNERFVNVNSIFIGNLPDRDRAAAFYALREPQPGELDDPRAQIGIWRTREAFAEMAAACGWDAQFSAMPGEFFSVHYRYDVLLRRSKEGA